MERLILPVENTGMLDEVNFFLDQALGYASAFEAIDVLRQLFPEENAVLRLDSHSHGSLRLGVDLSYNQEQ